MIAQLPLQEVVVHLCSGDQAVIPKQAVQAGSGALLNTMGVDDVIGDAPKAADWVSTQLGHCSVKHCIQCACAALSPTVDVQVP